MKIKLLLPLLLAFVTCLSYAQDNTSPVGTWKLISGKMIRNDSTFNSNQDSSESMKIVTPTHFAVFSKKLLSGSLRHAHSGTVKFTEKQYIEQINYSTSPGKVSDTAIYTYKLEGDKWYIEGGLTEMKVRYIEVWQRVKN